MTTTATTLGAASSFFLAGYAFSATQLASSAASLAPLGLRVQQWRVIFQNGAQVAPVGAIVGGLSWGYAAYSAYSRSPSGGEWKAYTAASGITLGTVAWTLLVMMPTNRQLLGLAAKADASVNSVPPAAALAALKLWDQLNLVRTVIPLVGGLVGLLSA